jgi:hypothetical protein
MIWLEHVRRSDRLMRATTSLTVTESDELTLRFDAAWPAAHDLTTNLREIH